MERLTPERIGTICGLLAPIVFVILYATAIALDPTYVFGEDVLSDLGVGSGAWAFNSAVILTGLLILPFAAWGLEPLGTRSVAWVTRGAFLAAGISLVGVGIWTEDAGVLHTYAAIAFFLLLTAGLALFLLIVAKNRAFGVVGAVATAVAFVLALILIFSGVDPLWETVGVLAAVVWIVFVSLQQLLGLTSEAQGAER